VITKIKPLFMTDLERDPLRQGLEGINHFQRILGNHFKLDVISH